MKFYKMILIFNIVSFALFSCSGGGTDMPNIGTGVIDDVSIVTDSVDHVDNENSVGDVSDTTEFIDVNKGNVDTITYGRDSISSPVFVLRPQICFSYSQQSVVKLVDVECEVPNKAGDSYHLDSMYVKYSADDQSTDSLIVNVSYSGGCEEHDFTISVDNVDTTLYKLTLAHNANGDMCEAYLSDRIAFSISKDLEITEYANFYIDNEENKIEYLKGE